MNRHNIFRSIFLLAITLTFSQCYSFKGTSIDPNVNTFYIAPFEDLVADDIPPPPTLPLTFTERLRDKIRQESRLKPTDVDPDIEFTGAITSYVVSSEAPQANETTAFNRLTMRVSVEYINHKKKEGEEEEPLKKTFSFFQDYPSSDNLNDVQDDLIETINNQLVNKLTFLSSLFWC